MNNPLRVLNPERVDKILTFAKNYLYAHRTTTPGKKRLKLRNM